MLWKKKEPDKTALAKVSGQIGSVPWLRVGVGVGMLGALWVVGQVVWMAVSAAAGLAALGVIGIVGVGAFQALPLLSQKWENRLLAARKQAARKNPIEQAQNEYLRRARQYEQFKAALENIGGQVAGFKSRLNTTRREKPQYDLQQETEACEKMELFYQNRKQRLSHAGLQLIAFREKIEEAQTKWEFQLQANAAIRAMNATDREAKMNEILTGVAFDSVQQEFDAIFAKLDIDAAEISSSKQLEFGGNSVIDVTAIEIPKTPQLAPVGAR